MGFLEHLLSPKSEEEMAKFKFSANMSCHLMKKTIERIEEIINDEEKVKHSDIAD